jgi:DNA mismatch repair protein MutH
MQMMEYDPKSTKSILEYAQRLKGQTLRQACGEEIEKADYKGKGGFGQTLERYYFGYEPNSNPEPDFEHVGMELKASPLKTLKNGRIQAKERIVLNIINYLDVHLETFETSTFWKKNSYLLLVFYSHLKNADYLDYLIHLVNEWKYPADDLEIIRQDWENINRKIQLGQAHELSEGDTFYLGACTKGSTAAGSLREQPFNTCQAKQRAYSLKQGYVNHIIATISGKENPNYGKIIQHPSVLQKHRTIEDFVVAQFEAFYGQSELQIQEKLGVKLNPKAKGFAASLSKAIFGIEKSKKISEFEKAEISLKTVRLKKNGTPKEDMSFPSFKYDEIVSTDWENSKFKKIVESKFLIVFFQIDDVGLILKKVKFWNMPYSDILEAKDVWDKTVSLVKSGNILKEIPVEDKPRSTFFPKKLSNRNKDGYRVSHVRPHGRNSGDNYPLPTPDRLTGVTEYTKHCFWFNASYVRDEIYLK